MVSTPPTSRSPPPVEHGSGLWGTLPLLVLTALLFVGAVLVYLTYPQIGPDHFPIWGLLLTLGFVAAIGSTVSYFWAVDEPTAEATGAGGQTPVAPGRADLGRPAPDVVRRPDPAGTAPTAGAAGSSADPWDEDVLPPAAPKGPRPVLTTPDDPGDIGRALEEIAEIQRQLVVRTKAPTPSAEAPARA